MRLGSLKYTIYFLHKNMGLAPTVQNVSTVNTLWMDRHLKYIKSSLRMDTKRIKRNLPVFGHRQRRLSW